MSVERLDSVILALGGGAARGLAHIGVLRGLAEDGVEVSGIAGTSMGSIIGALAAGGLDPDEVEAIFDEMDWQSVGSILLRSVVGEAFHDLLREVLGRGKIEALKVPFRVVCCDLDTGEQVVLSTGDIVDAVLASCDSGISRRSSWGVACWWTVRWWSRFRSRRLRIWARSPLSPSTCFGRRQRGCPRCRWCRAAAVGVSDRP